MPVEQLLRHVRFPEGDQCKEGHVLATGSVTTFQCFALCIGSLSNALSQLESLQCGIGVRNEILSNVVDRPCELGGGLLRLSNGLRFLLHAVDEAHTGAHQGQ